MIDVDILRNKVAELTSTSPCSLTDEAELALLAEWDSLSMVGVAAIIFEMTNASVTSEEIGTLVKFEDIVALAKLKIGAQ